MRQRRFRIGALVFATAIALGVWSASSLASSASRDRTSAKPVVIGISLSLSGDFSDEGKAAMRGYKLWQAHQNAHGGLLGRKIQLKIVDDTSQPESGRHELHEPDHQGQGRLRPRAVLDAAHGAVGDGCAPLRLRVHRAGRRRPRGLRGRSSTTSSSRSRRRDQERRRPRALHPVAAEVEAAEDRRVPDAGRPVRGAVRSSGSRSPRERTGSRPSTRRSTRPRRPTTRRSSRRSSNAKPDLIAAGTQVVDGYAMAKGLIQLHYNPKFLYIENGAQQPARVPGEDRARRTRRASSRRATGSRRRTSRGTSSSSRST